MDIRAAEISAILKEQIKNFGTEAEVTEAPSSYEKQRNVNSDSSSDDNMDGFKEYKT